MSAAPLTRLFVFDRFGLVPMHFTIIESADFVLEGFNDSGFLVLRFHEQSQEPRDWNCHFEKLHSSASAFPPRGAARVLRRLVVMYAIALTGSQVADCLQFTVIYAATPSASATGLICGSFTN